MKGKIVFFIGHINYIGGVEQWIYYIIKKYINDYDITVLYKWCAPNQLTRLNKLVRCVQYTNEEIECDKFIFCYDMSITDKVKAKDYILTIHADYKAQKFKIDIPKQTTKIYAVSDLARQSFEEIHKQQLKLLGLTIKTLYNPIKLDEPKRVLNLISATRLTPEKGAKRMEIMAKNLKALNLPFIWTIFTTLEDPSKIDGFIYMKPRLDILGYIKNADYLIQLSDTEGFAYSIVESLTLGTPVVVTDFPVAEEMGVKNGQNGYILKMDCSNIEQVIKDMYENYLKGFKYEPKESDIEYKAIFGKPDINYVRKEMKDMKYLIKFNPKYKYEYFDDTTELKDGKMVRRDKVSEPWIADLDRKDFLLSHGAIIVVEEIEEKKEELYIDKNKTAETNIENTEVPEDVDISKVVKKRISKKK